MAFTAAIAAAGCGSSAAPAVPSNSNSARTATPTAAGQADSGGVADTSSNPDRSYICAAAATNSGGQTIAYLTVAMLGARAGLQLDRRRH